MLYRQQLQHPEFLAMKLIAKKISNEGDAAP